jgi:hypothetical protein
VALSITPDLVEALDRAGLRGCPVLAEEDLGAVVVTSLAEATAHHHAVIMRAEDLHLWVGAQRDARGQLTRGSCHTVAQTVNTRLERLSRPRLSA